MTVEQLFAANSMVWPLAFLLIALLILRQLKEDVRPIFVSMLGSLHQHSARNAVAWAFAIMTATLASLQALQEVASQMGWVYVQVTAKVLQPGLAVLVAYGRPSPVGGIQTPTGTTPPFGGQSRPQGEASGGHKP